MARFDIKPLLDPEMAQVLAHQAARAGSLSVADSRDVEAIRRDYRDERAYWNEGGPEMAESHGLSLAGPHGPIPMRLHRPMAGAAELPCLIFFHGGGWVVGDLDTHDRIMRALAYEAKVAVLGVDYRLSPEAKFPVALEEACALLEHLAERAEDWGLDATRLALGGDSAGAHLSLASALQARDRQPGLIKTALLYYGAFGLKDSPSRRKFGGTEDGLSNQDMAFYKACLVRSPEDLNDPRIDLLRNDLEGLPPLFIAAAALDPLLDDSLLLADLAAASGLEHRLTVYDGVLHGFLHYGRLLQKARQALTAGAGWLQEKFTPI